MPTARRAATGMQSRRRRSSGGRQAAGTHPSGSRLSSIGQGGAGSQCHALHKNALGKETGKAINTATQLREARGVPGRVTVRVLVSSLVRSEEAAASQCKQGVPAPGVALRVCLAVSVVQHRQVAGRRASGHRGRRLLVLARRASQDTRPTSAMALRNRGRAPRS